MRIMNQKQILILTLTSLTFQVKVNLMFLKVIIIICLYIPQINQGLLNQTERNEGNQQGGVGQIILGGAKIIEKSTSKNLILGVFLRIFFDFWGLFGPKQ